MTSKRCSSCIAATSPARRPLQQIVAVNDEPLAILIKAIERVLAIAMFIFTDPRRTVAAADIAHSVEGFAGDGVLDIRTPPRYTTGTGTCGAAHRPGTL